MFFWKANLGPVGVSEPEGNECNIKKIFKRYQEVFSNNGRGSQPPKVLVNSVTDTLPVEIW